MNVTRTLTGRGMAVGVALSLATALVVPAVAMARYSSDTTICLAAPAAAPAATPTAATTAVTPVAASATADADLAADLAYMREEEKLARDVYNVLAEKWDLRAFGNIATSEQRHTDTILALLKSYGIDDPAAGKAAGEFTDPGLQKLYDDLVARGEQSATEAYAVGRLIEETDIKDLDERIARTDEATVLTVYQNLRAGSVNHLAAFSRTTATAAGTGQGAPAGRGGFGGGRGAGMGSGR